MTVILPECPNLETFFTEIIAYISEKSPNQLISLVEFSARTGLDREKTVLFFSMLSLSPNPFFKPVTIPYALGKTWDNFGIEGIITNKELFESIPTDLNDDGFVPLEEIELILNYKLCQTMK